MSLEAFERLPAEKRERILSTGIRAFSRRSYQETGTDGITKECGISKGLLFHYFGSKKAYYLYCLEKALSRLTEPAEPAGGKDFYEILFAELDRRMDACVRLKDETHLVNMASRDASAEIAREKAALLRRYTAAVREESARTLDRALASLELGNTDRETAAEGLRLYIGAVLNRYLLAYQQTPDRFFENGAEIRREMKGYLDLMLYGICGWEEP